MHVPSRSSVATGLRLVAGLSLALAMPSAAALSANPTSNDAAYLSGQTTRVTAPDSGRKGAARSASPSGRTAAARPGAGAVHPNTAAAAAGSIDRQVASGLGPQFEWVPVPGGVRRVTEGSEQRLTVREYATAAQPTGRLEIDEEDPFPLPQRPRPKVWATAADDLVSPTTGNLLRDGLLKFDRNPAIVAHRIGNETWNTGDRTIRLGVNSNRVARFQLIAELLGKQRRLLVKADNLTGPRPLPADRCVFVSRFWYTLARGERRIDGCWDRPTLIPVFEPLRVPPTDNPVAGQTNQAFMVEIRIPKQVLSGTYSTTVHVTDLDDPTYAEDVYVEVAAWPNTRQMRSIR